MKEDFFSVNFLIALALVLSIGLVVYNAFLMPEYVPATVTIAEPEPAASDPSVISEPSGDGAPTSVNVNTATKEELQTIPGIGPVLADRILQYREKVGVIIDKQELLEVNGIGDAIYQKIAPWIDLE